MISGIFIFDFDRKMMEIMHVLPTYSLTFGQMGMDFDGVAPTDANTQTITQTHVTLPCCCVTCR